MLLEMGQLSLEQTFLIAPYVEGIVYGIFAAIFAATMYIHFSKVINGTQRFDRHSNVMIGISSLMFLIATLHLTINAYRMVAGYVDHALLQGGAVAYMGDLRSWHYILKDTLYATQENLGSAAAIYRCWVLWGHNWKIILFPSVLLIVNIVAGYMVCGLYDILSAYCSLECHHYLPHELPNLVHPPPNILVYQRSDVNAQYIVLESIASIVGITFNALTIRIKLHSISTAGSGHSMSFDGATQTIGRLPMRRIQRLKNFAASILICEREKIILSTC
ncbi:vacuolar triacylglycerol lipase [Lentinula edodes]|uniref:Vacuolar triacylglycerol lipase n=1 Tax=Lentinula edodes TaxID=5353 RepID=A0A1Q3E0D3_LENED|nr:vacuolar triacylglycerol lipase [Lentinula edodes]